MAPNNPDLLHGLDLIRPPPTPTTLASSDADVLSAGPYTDLAAQLDLWSSNDFATDEPFVASRDWNPDLDGEKKDLDVGGTASDFVKRKRHILAGRKLQQLQQIHNPGAVPTLPPTSMPTTTATAPYDLSTLLAVAGNQLPAQSVNLNQILALQAFASPFQAAFGGMSFAQPLPIPTVPPVPATALATPAAPEAPAAKRAKTRKNSVPARRASTSAPDSPEDVPQSPTEQPQDEEPSHPLTSAEDKRRRNTQASARFRLKKKEREQTMEIRSKELEAKVSELEKECEALRRENGWLKGLVVGVTGGTGMQVTMPTGPGLPTITPAPGLQPAAISGASSSKRKRDDSRTA